MGRDLFLNDVPWMMSPIRDERTERRAARDFDLLSVLNGYPETFSVFEGEPLILRVAYKPGIPLPRLIVRALWSLPATAALRFRVVRQNLTRRTNPAESVYGRAVRIDVQDSVQDTLYRSYASQPPAPILAEAPASHMDNGAAYSGTIALDTTGWPPGVYECAVHDERGRTSEDIYVNIKPRSLENIDLLCILPSFTWQAYNRMGGGSFYSPELGHVRTICTQRPMHHRSDNSIVPCLASLKLFQRAGVRIACVDSWDLHCGLLPAGAVPVAAILVHDEYWSSPMRGQIDRLLDSGASLLVLGGNTCWWHVDVQGPNISVRKDPAARQLWHLVDLPEEQTFVSSFRFAGYAMERAKQKPRLAPRIAHLSRGEVHEAGAITVTEPEHPLFAGIPLKNGRTFGHDVPVVYRELDGVPLDGHGRIDLHKYNAKKITPRVLATGLAIYGRKLGATGLVVEAGVRNGYVLHMGSVGWSRGITQRNDGVCRIVLNAYHHCRVQADRRKAEKTKRGNANTDHHRPATAT